ELKKDRIKHILLKRKQVNFDDYKKIDKIVNFDFSNEDYRNIEGMIDYCETNEITILTPNSRNIPLIFLDLKRNLRELVFIKGNIQNQDLKSYSICGTRNPTDDAIKKTQEIAKFFAKRKYTLINGYAKGIDIQAFFGAGAQNGRYIGVLASGVENVYPPENRQYESKVIENGAIISQRLIWNRVNKISLQMRNRFSAELSNGSIFIEGNYKSGTKWQHKFSKEAGKPVFYLEPKDWSHENSFIPKMIKEQGGIEIRNDLSNLEEVEMILREEYVKRVKKVGAIEKNSF
ncbi:MAG: DNA-processing protein DprA, partial [Promethearchaeota archaeon]